MTRIIHTGITLFVAFWLVILSCGAAAKEARSANSSASGCKNAAEKIGDLGITSMSFRGSMRYNTENGERSWYFQAEPEIHKVDPKGPAVGKLEGGDVIVAIDGLPITTRQAGQKFANVAPGEGVKLTVRRGGRLVDTAIVPRAVCPEDHPMIIDPADLTIGSTVLENLGLTVEKLSRLAEVEARYDEIRAELEGLFGSLEVPAAPGRPGEPGAIPAPRPFPKHPAWFGMSISPDGCTFKATIKASKTGGPLEWRFDTPPKVGAVEPGSPAEKAGIEAGDRITHIDGLKIDSDEGGKRFSSIKPGETVEVKVRRDGVEKVMALKAMEPPQAMLEREEEYERAVRAYEERARSQDAKARDIEELARQREIVARERAMEYEALAREYEHDAQTRGIDPESLPVRFIETVDAAKIEVRGEDSVSVIRDEAAGEIVIRTRDSFVRIKLPEKKK
jgi:membrane-associated protease RseP (regulator of RpoE activity)